jgi:multiple antibiotic resistance protein
MNQFLGYFIPLFVAIDAFGLAPLFLGVTQNLSAGRRRQILFEAVGAAFVICIGFMFLGQVIFRFLGITEADFRIAGGILLLVLAVLDLLSRGTPAVDEHEMIGIVPLAMPLIAGPATLTTVLVLASRGPSATFSYSMTALSLALNLAFLLLLLLGAARISGRIGMGALQAFSKLVMVLLAAIAVNFIRVGVLQVIAQAKGG